MIFHCVRNLLQLHPSICWWTCRLFQWLGCCKRRTQLLLVAEARRTFPVLPSIYLCHNWSTPPPPSYWVHFSFGFWKIRYSRCLPVSLATSFQSCELVLHIFPTSKWVRWLGRDLKGERIQNLELRMELHSPGPSLSVSASFFPSEHRLSTGSLDAHSLHR